MRPVLLEALLCVKPYRRLKIRVFLRPEKERSYFPGSNCLGLIIAGAAMNTPLEGTAGAPGEDRTGILGVMAP